MKRQVSAPSANVVLVAGASGVIGAEAVAHFSRLPDWQVIALSRRRPHVPNECPFRHVALDLSDRAACVRALADLPPISHLVYAAVAEAPGLVGGWRDSMLMEHNAQMFANLLDPLASSGDLRHVSLLQGAKAYGGHVHPITLPLREDSPRDPHANFYWLQEDHLRMTSAAAGFAFTLWRPQILLGSAPGAAMNPVAAIGAYAALCHERSLPFALPGTSEALWELVDATLLAEAFIWAATHAMAADQTFNITNGDVFVLRHTWDRLAQNLGLVCSGPAPDSFAQFFAEPQNQAAWRTMASRHNLLVPSLDGLLGQSHTYLDLLNGARIAEKATPVLLSTIKLRQAGFVACRDSLTALISHLRHMAKLRLLPPFPKQ
ncbi:MAG: hypothetical protein RLZZ136_1768 [Pseudomonadota bacterium]|jgi:nucleoside-diphosphate-sugar epimerase